MKCDSHKSLPIFVTGGAGFIGSNFILDWFATSGGPVVNLDKLTYAGNLSNLGSLASREDYCFVRGDICDAALLAELFATHRPRAVVHFAAETHVDRSIAGPAEFLQTNVNGTFTLLQAATAFLQTLEAEERQDFRFLHVSTDEVFGTLTPEADPFREDTAYAPNSPYAASKASSDHLARAWFHTFGLPTLVTNCSNNYGPLQFPEKLLPLMITQAVAGKPLPVYGDGLQVRDWLYVGDHGAAIRAVLAGGRVGETYNIGGGNQRSNLEVVTMLCELLDELCPTSPHIPHTDLISFVEDRPGHDRRYAIDAAKIERELGWRPQESFESGLRKTVQWYLANMDWLSRLDHAAQPSWMAEKYGASVRNLATHNPMVTETRGETR